MDVNRYINLGGEYVQNPNYTKSNGQPKYILSTNVPKSNVGSNLLSGAELYTTNFSDNPLSEDMYDRGLPLRRDDYLNNNFNDILADAQSNWAKTGNMLIQTAVSEVGLGTLKAFSDIFDAAYNILTATKDDVNDFTNPVSKQLEEWKEKINNDIAPIYVQSGVDILNGGFGNVGWYMKNLPSIASSITLMIPGRVGMAGLSKAFNFVNRASGLGNNTLTRRLARGITRAAGVKTTKDGIRLNSLGTLLNDSRTIKLTNEITKDLGTATFMRVAENYQESRETYKEMYDIARDRLGKMSDIEFTEWYNRHKDEIDEQDFANNDRDTIAKKIAEKSANRTFKEDMINVVFDVAQLWGLRDATKIFKNVSSTKILADHRQSILNLGKTTEEVAKLATESSKLSKVANTFKDVIRGTGKATILESTEGVEEMVNYVASQEGLTLGKVLLDDVKPSTFLSRMEDYWHSPELWESAFWGLMGGVVFHGLGSAHNQYRLKKEVSKAKKKREKDDTTEEEVTPSSWYELEEMPEIKAARVAIQGRNARTEDMFSKISRIKAGYNIFKEDDPVTKTTPKFEGTEEQIKTAQAKAIENVVDQYLADIVADAMHTGTFDTLLEYFGSNQMQDAMVNQGIVANANDAYTYVEQIKNKANNINKIYNEQISHISSHVNYLNYTNKNNIGSVIPLEYVQMIAKSNLDNILVVNNLNRQEGIVDARISELMSLDTIQSVLDESIPYADILGLGDITSAYAEYEARKKQIQADDSLSELDKFVAVSKIEKNQKVLLNELEKKVKIGNQTSSSIGRVLFTLRAAQQAHFVKDGDTERLSYELTPDEVLKTDKELLETAGYNLSEIEANNAGMLADEYGGDINAAINGLLKEAEKTIDENDETAKQVKEASAELYNLFMQKGHTQINKALYNSDIAVTQKDIIDKVNLYHNVLSEARGKAVDKAAKTIMDIYAKYKEEGKEDVVTTAISMFLDGRRNQAQVFLNDNFEKHEADNIISSFDILNLNSDNNLKLAEFFQGLIAHKKLVDTIRSKKGGEEIEETEETEESSASTTTTPESSLAAEEESKPKEKKSRKKVRGKKRRARKAAREAEEAVRLAEESNKMLEEEHLKQAEEAESETEETPEAEQVVEEETDISSTGEPSATNPSNPLSEKKEEPTRTPTYEELLGNIDSAITKITPNLMSIIRDDNNTNVDELISSIKESILEDNKEYMTEEQYDEFNKVLTNKINALTNRLKKVQEVYKNPKHTLADIAQALTYASRIGTMNSITLPDIIIEGIEKFVDKYLEASLTPIKDGKKVLNIKEILNICKQSVSDVDGNIQTYVLDKLKSYLRNPLIKEKYFIVDEETLTKDLAVVNDDKSKENIETQKSVMRVNIIDYIDFYNDSNVTTEEQSKNYFEVLNSLRSGDILELDITNDVTSEHGNGTIYISKNGTVIGSGRLPKIVGNGYVQGNKGFLEDVALNQGGEITSNALDLYKNIFTSDEQIYKDLRDIILDAVAGKEVTQEIINKFLNSEFVKDAKKNRKDLFTNNAKDINKNAKSMLEHLVSLWNYSNQNITFSTKEEHIGAINYGLTMYFDNLYTTYDTVSKLKTNGKVKVEYINDGQVITKFDNDKVKENHDKLPFAKEAIANRETTKLAIYDNGAGVVKISGEGPAQNKGLTNTQALLALHDRNGEIDYVTVDYLTKDDLSKSSGFNEIITLAKNYFRNHLEKVVSSNINGLDFAQILDVLQSIVGSNTNDRISLLRGKAGNNAIINTEITNQGYRKVYINFRNTEDSIEFTLNKKNEVYSSINRSGFKKLNTSDVTSFVNQMFDVILDNTNSEISIKGIETDTSLESIDKGFIRRTKDGKIINTLTDKVYNSYNDFIIDNDLIRVNLAKGRNGSNYQARGSRQIRNQVMYVSVNTETSSPVEGIDTATYNPEISATSTNKDIVNKVMSAFNNGVASGKDLFIAALGEERYAKFLNEAGTAGILESILPKSMKYHPRFNYGEGERANTEAATNTGAKDALIHVQKADGSGRTTTRVKSEQVLIGDKFISYICGVNRPRAIAIMIHEQLHNLMANNKNYTKRQILDAIAPIYNEFIAGCEKIIAENDKDSLLYQQAEFALKGIRRYNKDKDRQLEEFLIETITNDVFMNLMNNIDAETETETKDNLFTKLIKFLSKYLFNINIEKGKLLQKEIVTLSKLINDKQEKINKERQNIVTETAGEKSGRRIITNVKRMPIVNNNRNTNNKVDDEFESNIGILESFSNTRKDGFLSALPVEQQLKFAAMQKQGAFNYVCSIN